MPSFNTTSRNAKNTVTRTTIHRPSDRQVGYEASALENNVHSTVNEYTRHLEELKSATHQRFDQYLSQGRKFDVKNFPTERDSRKINVGEGDSKIGIEIIYEGVQSVSSGFTKLFRGGKPKSSSATMYAVIHNGTNTRLVEACEFSVYEDGTRLQHGDPEAQIADYLRGVVKQAISKVIVEQAETSNHTILNLAFESNLVCEVANMLTNPFVIKKYREIAEAQSIEDYVSISRSSSTDNIDELSENTLKELKGIRAKVVQFAEGLKTRYDELKKELDGNKSQATGRINDAVTKAEKDIADYRDKQIERIDQNLGLETAARKEALEQELKSLEEQVEDRRIELLENKGAVKERVYFLNRLNAIFPDYNPCGGYWSSSSSRHKNQSVGVDYKSELANALHETTAGNNVFINSDQVLNLVELYATHVRKPSESPKHNRESVQKIVDDVAWVITNLEPESYDMIYETIKGMKKGRRLLELSEIHGALEHLLRRNIKKKKRR